MNTPGSVLKAEREKQNRSIKDVSKELKIQAEYLKAIEEDDYSSLPAEVFTKSYMRLYADALHIDSDYVFELYNNQVKVSIPGEEEEDSVKKNVTGFSLMIDSFRNILSACSPSALINKLTGHGPLPEISSLRNHLNYKTALIITAFMLIIVSVAVVTTREEQVPPIDVNVAAVDDTIDRTVDNAAADTAYDTADDTEDELDDIAALADIPALGEYEEEPFPDEEALVHDEEEPVHARMSLKVIATDITWISARIDDGPPHEWFLRKQDTVTIDAYEKFTVKIGNAGGTKLFLDGEDLGVLGAPGKVIDVVIP